MRTAKLIGAVLLLCVSGCSNDPVYHGDLSFTPAERAAIEAGILTIGCDTDTTPFQVVWDGDLDASHTILNQPPPGKATSGRFVIPEGSTDRRLYLLPHQPLGQLRAVTAHEFGHALGMDHHDGPGRMAWTAQDVWTKEDESECRRVGVCR